MTAHELLAILSRLPHDAIIQIDNNGTMSEPDRITVEMSADLYEQRDHIIFICNKGGGINHAAIKNHFRRNFFLWVAIHSTRNSRTTNRVDHINYILMGGFKNGKQHN